MESVEYLVILNYNTGEVFYKEMTEAEEYMNEFYGVEALLKKFNFNIDECSWMFTNNKPALQYLDE